MKNFILDKKIFPRFLKDGLYRVFLYVSNSEKVIENGVEVEFKLY